MKPRHCSTSDRKSELARKLKDLTTPFSCPKKRGCLLGRYAYPYDYIESSALGYIDQIHNGDHSNNEAVQITDKRLEQHKSIAWDRYIYLRFRTFFFYQHCKWYKISKSQCILIKIYNFAGGTYSKTSVIFPQLLKNVD